MIVDPPTIYLVSGGVRPDIPSDVQISGNCAKGVGLGPAPYFNWVVKAKY